MAASILSNPAIEVRHDTRLDAEASLDVDRPAGHGQVAGQGSRGPAFLGLTRGTGTRFGNEALGKADIGSISSSSPPASLLTFTGSSFGAFSISGVNTNPLKIESLHRAILGSFGSSFGGASTITIFSTCTVFGGGHSAATSCFRMSRRFSLAVKIKRTHPSLGQSLFSSHWSGSK